MAKERSDRIAVYRANVGSRELPSRGGRGQIRAVANIARVGRLVKGHLRVSLPRAPAAWPPGFAH